MIIYMSDQDATTQSLLTDLIEAVNSIGTELHSFCVSVEKRLDKLDSRVDKIETRLDRIESLALETHPDMKEFKAEFNEFRSQFKQPA